jgi:hypothetical protein
MRCRHLLVLQLLLPAALTAQSSAPPASPRAVMTEFELFANRFGSLLVTAFDSIPPARYGYRPTESQQSVGYIAQHLEAANYGLCERLGDARHHRSSKDSLADTLKARWPKDSLLARLRASLAFCDSAMARLELLNSVELAGTLLAFETDLAEHYSQLATYMRILGLVPPSALPLKQRRAITMPVSELSKFVGRYEVAVGLELEISIRDGALSIRSTPGGVDVGLWPETERDFFAKERDAQVTFNRDSSGSVTGLVLHQFGRDTPARRLR